MRTIFLSRPDYDAIVHDKVVSLSLKRTKEIKSGLSGISIVGEEKDIDAIDFFIKNKKTDKNPRKGLHSFKFVL